MKIMVAMFGFAMLIFGVVIFLTAFVLHLGRILSTAVCSFGGGCAVMGIFLLIVSLNTKDD